MHVSFQTHIKEKIVRCIYDGLLLVTLVSFLPKNTFGQFDRQLWYIGDERANSGMIFGNSLSQPIPTNLKGLIDLSESNVMLANTSVVNFYSNGATIINELSRPMPNGQVLKGSPRSMYGSALIDSPAACDQFYLFYTESTEDGPNRNLYYSLIDMTIEVQYVIFKGFGDVIVGQKDIDITPTTVDIGESIYTLDKTVPKEGTWLFASDRNSSSIFIYNVDASGISLHRAYNLSHLFPGYSSGKFSTVKFDSHSLGESNSVLIVAPSSEEGITGFPIGSFTFNHQTGYLEVNSLRQIANITTSTYGTAFSSDGSKFYYSDHIDKTLHQYDFISGNTTLIGTSTHDGKSGGLQLAINNEIYWASQYSVNPPETPIESLSVIRQPNQPGAGCALDLNAYAINTSSLPVRIGIFPTILSEAIDPKVVIFEEPACGLQNGVVGILVSPKLEPLTYKWNNGSTERNLTNVGKGIYKVEMTSLDGCMFTDSIEVFEIPDISLTNVTFESTDPTSCSSKDGQITFSSPDFIQGNSFEIMFSDEVDNDYLFLLEVNDDETISIEGLPVGTYLDFSIRGSNENCSLPLKDTILMSGLLDNPDLGRDTLLCDGETYLLKTEGSFTKYLWSDGSTESTLAVNQTGIYSVEVTDSNGCSSTNTVYIQYSENPDVSLDQVIELEIGDSIVLMPTISTIDALSYDWTPPEGLSCTDCLSPTAKPLRNQEYIFTVFNESDCIDSASVLININNKTGLLFPNTFSPNGDGNNDIFEYTISSEAVQEVKSFIVFNRWGEPTFERRNIQKGETNFGWNGKHGDADAKVGVYVYSVEVELINGQIIYGHGDVLILR